MAAGNKVPSLGGTREGQLWNAGAVTSIGDRWTVVWALRGMWFEVFGA